MEAYFARSLLSSSTRFGPNVSASRKTTGTWFALVLVMPPLPIGLLVGLVALFKLHMVAVRAMFPPVVVDDFVIIPSMVVAVIPVIDVRVNSATGGE